MPIVRLLPALHLRFGRIPISQQHPCVADAVKMVSFFFHFFFHTGYTLIKFIKSRFEDKNYVQSELNLSPKPRVKFVRFFFF